jgi:hypothetical protein
MLFLAVVFLPLALYIDTNQLSWVMLTVLMANAPNLFKCTSSWVCHLDVQGL